MDEKTDAAAAPARRPCRHLRTKMYYVMGRDHVDLVEGSPDAQYWCSLTTTALGPDDVLCSAAACHRGRACFHPEGD